MGGRKPCVNARTTRFLRSSNNPTAAGSIASADLGDGGTDDPRELARQAIDPDPAIAEPAIAALRALGRDGHTALLDEHRDTIAPLRDTGRTHDPAVAERVRHAVDVVSGQRDGHASGLYWHTDLELARAESRRTGRPILSLRLLGRLDEEMSCANSRFFRVVLYPDREVARLLSGRFVLHWSSERPAPRITIDMGDGRRIERTITGNSVHYVIDPSGRVIDAIPGLYAPTQFRIALERAASMARACAGGADEAFAACRAEQHARAIQTARAAYAVRAVGPDWDRMLGLTGALPADPTPSAIDAMPRTVGKAAIETSLLRVMARDPSTVRVPETLDWRAAGAADLGSSTVDPRTVALVRLKTGSAAAEADAAELRSVAAADGARNEATLHRTVHGWYVAGGAAMDAFETLNARVYTELFLTPAGDPWLGLRDPRLWDAIETP